MRVFLQIWTGRVSVFSGTLGFSGEVAEYLTKMIKYIHQPSEMALVRFLLDLVDNADDFFPPNEKADQREADILEGKLIFLHLVLLILAGDLAEGLGSKDPEQTDSMSKPMTFLLS